MYRRLSYTLNVRDHAFPGAPTMRIEPFESMQKGDRLNTYNVTLFNHFGTHMDGPNHFNGQGRQLYELELSTFIFEKPLLVDIPKGRGELVEPEELMRFDEAIRAADLLLVRSGFSAMRASDNRAYSEEGPAISARAAELIVERYQNLKAVGMDWISLSSPLHLEDGIRAHQIMLGKTGAEPVLIIEDIDLSGLDPDTLETVFALPLFIEGIDSAPVTILAKIRD
ncbi:cyclase family protein [Anaerotruncus sp. 1XD42-93]|uniref:cyclase family protein n=1 Tax=Anaerotruncus sp. 1XD42-93 TaxID=2320853 RepID=UPI000EA1CCDD|nr:cyclase family protein [Anaerotruncus sp. 1XD42-93]NBK19859.1 cyclase family protein [Anaerotruncus sp. 1XD42-93]RKJ77135.1 cyclase family protein [Anaerotruncus sp. 1XD22-93]